MSIHQPLFFIFFFKITFVISRSTEFEQELEQLTERVIFDYFHHFQCITYVFGEGIEMRLSQQLPVFLIRLPVESQVVTESYEQGCGGYVVRVKNKFDVSEILIGAKRRSIGHRYNKQRYLFLPVNATDADLEFLGEPKMFFLPNLVMVTKDRDSFSVFTHNLFDNHKYEILGITHEVIDVWTPQTKFFFGNNLYPDKLSNVKGMRFVLSSTNYAPFSVIKTVDGEKTYDGLETRIAAEFVRMLNGTWEGLDNAVELWGNVFPDGTGSGIVGSVLDHRADFGYGAIYQWYCRELDCSFPLYQSGVTCLVPRPLLLSGELTIILPFTRGTWLALVTVYIISSSFVLSILLALDHMKGFRIKEKLGKAASDSFFTIFRLQLEQIPIIPKSKNPLSVYVKITVYYYFFVAAFWQGGIASFLTVPRFEKPINTAQDLLDRWPEVEWGANSNSWVILINHTFDPILIEITKKFVIYDDETLLKKPKQRNFGFFMERLMHGHYGFNDYITEESMKYLKIMEANIYRPYGVIVLPRNCPFLEKFNHYIHWIYDTGIIHKTEVQVSLEIINNRLQKMIAFSNRKEQNTVILAVSHILGPIYIYFAGMTLAFLAFLLEIFIGRQKTLGKNFRNQKSLS